MAKGTVVATMELIRRTTLAMVARVMPGVAAVVRLRAAIIVVAAMAVTTAPAVPALAAFMAMTASIASAVVLATFPVTAMVIMSVVAHVCLLHFAPDALPGIQWTGKTGSCQGGTKPASHSGRYIVIWKNVKGLVRLLQIRQSRIGWWALVVDDLSVRSGCKK